MKAMSQSGRVLAGTLGVLVWNRVRVSTHPTLLTTLFIRPRTRASGDRRLHFVGQQLEAGAEVARLEGFDADAGAEGWIKLNGRRCHGFRTDFRRWAVWV